MNQHGLLSSNEHPIELFFDVNRAPELLHGLDTQMDLVESLEEPHPLSDCQWGFRAGLSTVTALLSTINDGFSFWNLSNMYVLWST